MWSSHTYIAIARVLVYAKKPIVSITYSTRSSSIELQHDVIARPARGIRGTAAVVPLCCCCDTYIHQVAGGLGERLGYDGIKLALPVEVRGKEVQQRCTILLSNSDEVGIPKVIRRINK